MILKTVKTYIFAGVAVACIAIGTAGFVYVKGVIAENEALAKDNTTLLASNESLQETLDAVTDAQEKQSQITIQLNEQLSLAEQRLSELRTMFLEHDLTNLALEKPGLIERRMNDATKDVFDSIEFSTSR